MKFARQEKAKLQCSKLNQDEVNNNTFITLIVVSNRLAFILKYNEETDSFERKYSASGLVTALSSLVVQSSGLWIGFPGVYLQDYFGMKSIKIPEPDPLDKASASELKAEQVIPMNIDKETYCLYYNSCCNAAFWPLFHSMSDRAIFNPESWEAYSQVNFLFAEKILETLRKISDGLKSDSPIPIVWIHDYHLLLAANRVRLQAEEENLKCKLGFFLHIPFPSYDLFRLFPHDDEVLQGMLGCDLVSFHIEDYVVNFLDCCKRSLGCRIDIKNSLVEYNGRIVRVRSFSMGIPFDSFVHLAKKAKKSWENDEQRIILGVDRLDYTKGLVHRLRAFEHLLEKWPEYIEKVTLLQIVVPSRIDIKAYQELKEELDNLVGKINGKFSSVSWNPIRYLYGFVSQDKLAGFYRDSAIALVTSLRDGMNLVAKEFVACQINEPGVLVLSSFAGAAEMLREALIINPYEIDNVADILHRALTMSTNEREIRMFHLRKREKLHDVNHWMNSFLKAMGNFLKPDYLFNNTGK